MPADAKTAVVTDTTAYLPEELVAQHDIKRVSLYVSLDGEQRPEIEIAGADYAEFFERLRASAEGATTSQPSVGDFCAVYEPLLAEGRDIVSIHLSAGISGTCESASQARQRLTGRRERAASASRSTTAAPPAAARPWWSCAAAAAAERGEDGAGALAAAERARDELDMWFAIDTLEYLRKGGRIGAAQAWLGSALQIKPILTLGEEITPGRAGAHQAPRVRADGRLRAPAPRRRRGRLGRPAHPGPRDRTPPGGAVPRASSAPSPSSSPRSAR